MNDIIGTFAGVTANPYQTLADWKQRTGKKIIACFPMHVPEELIHAAGMLPVVMWESNELITVAHGHVSPFNCGLVRSIVDDAVRGKLSFLDGTVLYDTCLQARSMPFLVGQLLQPAYTEILYLSPVLTSSVTKSFLMENLERFKTSLEKFSGQEITSARLRESIEIYNENRRLLRQLYELRRKNPGLLRAKEVLAIVRSSMLMPKEEHSELLQKLLPQLENARPVSDRRIKVVLVGNLCQAPATDILDAVEEAGGVVVDDDLFTGYRYFANDCDVSDNLIESLVERFRKRVPPCPTKVDWETEWADYVMNVVKRSGARGVVTLLVKYCPPHMTYYPDVKRRLAAAGVPELMLETEHEVVSLAQIKTRLRAFIETLGGA
ncbi:MAG: 2-hydroxyacyl-CoA dehydratase [Chloroflexi bacterium]|nr:2-hydroxyacyl-CoA dehydratase [Chloroflexota bacterium]